MAKSAVASSSNFDLKRGAVILLGPTRAPVRTAATARELEEHRVRRAPVPASKHGLEILCGATSETGAQ